MYDSQKRARTEVKRFEVPAAEKRSDKKRTPSSKERRKEDAESRLEQGLPMERCCAVLDLMLLRPDAAWFREPVPVEAVPDYLEVVGKPSDYATVRERLSEGQYGEDVLAFAADMRLIFTNAVKCAAQRARSRTRASRRWLAARPQVQLAPRPRVPSRRAPVAARLRVLFRALARHRRGHGP